MSQNFGLHLRSPSHAVHRVALSTEYSVLRFTSVENVQGQWLAYLDLPGKQLSGVCNGARMDRLGDTLIFDIKMTDTGEEFVVFRHSYGINILCIQLSPFKCSVEQYHKYIIGYSELLSPPVVGERSIGGSESKAGREPSYNEASFRFIHKAVSLAELAMSCRSERGKHPRERGGESAIDVESTLAAWKSNHNWYKVISQGVDFASSERGVITIGGKIISPLRAVRKESNTFNLFIGSAIKALGSVSRAVGIGSIGGIVRSLLMPASNYLQAGDTPSEISESEAWRFLERQAHPPRSGRFASALIDFRNCLACVDGHAAISGGHVPFLLAAPEIIFQLFVTAKVLLSLGLPRAHLEAAMRDVRSGAGCKVNNFTVWADTSQHRLAGWRDHTAKPAAYEPDLIIVDGNNQRTILLDAKFRRDPIGLLPSSGIKDIQAYMHEYGLVKAVIAVPSGIEDPPSETIEANGFAVHGVGVTPDICHSSIEGLMTELEKTWNFSGVSA